MSRRNALKLGATPSFPLLTAFGAWIAMSCVSSAKSALFSFIRVLVFLYTESRQATLGVFDMQSVSDPNDDHRSGMKTILLRHHLKLWVFASS